MDRTIRHAISPVAIISTAAVRAGLPPIAVLRAATTTAAESLGHDKEFGSIAPGKFADLVLLTADPLADIANAGKIDLVMKGGKTYRPVELLRTTGPGATSKDR